MPKQPTPEPIHMPEVSSIDELNANMRPVLFSGKPVNGALSTINEGAPLPEPIPVMQPPMPAPIPLGMPQMPMPQPAAPMPQFMLLPVPISPYSNPNFIAQTLPTAETENVPTGMSIAHQRPNQLVYV